MTLEEYFRTQHHTYNGVTYPVIDHALRCEVSEGKVTFYIHPANHSGDTENFEVRGNSVWPDPRVRKYANVWINGTLYNFIENTVLPYEAVIALAGRTGNPSTTVSVKGQSGGRTLTPGDWVQLVNNTIINCYHTNNA